MRLWRSRRTPAESDGFEFKVGGHSTIVPRITGPVSGRAAAAIAALQANGGILRCQACSAEQPLGDIREYLADDWPTHCGQTMKWVTASQVEAEWLKQIQEEGEQHQ